MFFSPKQGLVGIEAICSVHNEYYIYPPSLIAVLRGCVRKIGQTLLKDDS